MNRLLGLVGVLTLGCGRATDDPTAFSGHQEAVIGGVDSAETDDGVLVLRTDRIKDTSVCSSSLIAPNLLLTARHCIVAEYPADNIRCRPDGTLMAPSGGQLGVPTEPENVHVFSGQQPMHDASSNLPGGAEAAIATQIITTDWPSVCRDDIALVVLDRDLDLPTVPLDLSKVVTKTTRVSVLGYGLTEVSAEADRWSTRRRRDSVLVKYVDTLPNTFAVGRSVCKGDSGGPALDSESGGILGVYSLGFPGETKADCSAENALNYYAQVNRYPDLLRQGFEAAGQPFPGEEPSGAGGVGGESGAPGGEVPPGGEANASGGAGGEPSTTPSVEQPASASGGCQFLGGVSQSGFGMATLLGLAVFGRRRRSR